MSRTPVFDIKIDITGETVHLKTENGQVDMIPFRGTVKGPLFEGIVEPCGVDTQVVNAAHIYVENNGWFDERTGPMTMPFHTVPTFYTDSPALIPYLHRNQFEGEGHMLEDGLHILFFQVEP